MNKETPEHPNAPVEERDIREPPLKTVRVWLELPIEHALDSLEEDQPKTKPVKVEVRIYKSGGSTRNF